MDKNKLLSYHTLVHASAGSVGSMTAVSVFFPLDTVRSRLQVDEERRAKSTLQMLEELVKEEGFTTLYRGLTPVIQSLCVSNFIYFYTFHSLKKMVGNRQSIYKDLVLGSVAGIINVLTTTPLWVVNTRIKLQGVRWKSQKRVHEHHYKGVLDGLATIVKEEGVPGLWKGTLASLILVCNPSIQFALYESMKRRLLAGGKKELSTLSAFMVGSIAKIVATLLTYPIQLVQNKLRHGHRLEGLKQDANMTEMLMFIWRAQGVKGLFKGLEAKLWQTVLTAALMFVSYEKIVSTVFRVMGGVQSKKVK